MSDERFEVVQDPRVQTEYFIYDNENKISENITDYPFDDQDVCSRIVMLLNEQHEEITQLKFQLQNTCDQRDEFYRGARENANRVGKLEKENEQLSKEHQEMLEKYVLLKLKIGEVLNDE